MKGLSTYLAFFLGVSILTGVVCAQSTFQISDSTGEPLIETDQIIVDSSISYPSNYIYSDANFFLYYQGTLIGPVHIPFDKQHLYLDGSYQLQGYADMEYGDYTWADELMMEVLFARPGFPGQLHHTSINTLQVTPLTERAPSITTWGLIILLILIPAIMLFRR